MLPFSADGQSPPRQFLGVGTFGSTVINKDTPERVRELLGVLNYIAAPFGSQEKLLGDYGVKDVDFSFDITAIRCPSPTATPPHRCHSRTWCRVPR